MKSVVILATVHEYQVLGNARNSELEKRLDYLISKFGAQIVMEEWSENQRECIAKGFATKLDLHWANVGTPDEPEYRTYTKPINCPGYDGTLQLPEFADGDELQHWMAPEMDEYGPFENQEAREDRMTKNVQAETENYESGLFVLGLAHLHSIFGKLRSLGFKVTAFSWLGI